MNQGSLYGPHRSLRVSLHFLPSFLGSIYGPYGSLLSSLCPPLHHGSIYGPCVLIAVKSFLPMNRGSNYGPNTIDNQRFVFNHVYLTCRSTDLCYEPHSFEGSGLFSIERPYIELYKQLGFMWYSCRNMIHLGVKLA